MFKELEEINARPQAWSHYTAAELWTDEHTSRRMLAYHLDGTIDVSSRRGEFIDRSAAWLGAHLGVGPGLRVIDLGCGPGLYAIRLARLGAAVTGVDFSPRSIAHAREAAAAEGLGITYLNDDYLACDPGSGFDLALMIMCDFCALAPGQRRTLLDKIKQMLKPGGRLVLDAYTLNMFAAREEAATYGQNLLDGFWSPEPYYGFLNTFKYELENVLLDKYTIVEEGRTRVVYNWLQCFSPESLSAELTAAGFQVAEILGDVAGGAHDPDGLEMAVVAVSA